MVNLNNISIDERNYLKLKRAGVLPRYINSGYKENNKTNIAELKSRIPFSTNYRTYQEYLSDQEKISNMACNGLEIPDDIVKRLQMTNEELGK